MSKARFSGLVADLDWNRVVMGAGLGYLPFDPSLIQIATYALLVLGGYICTLLATGTAHPKIRGSTCLQGPYRMGIGHSVQVASEPVGSARPGSFVSLGQGTHYLQIPRCRVTAKDGSDCWKYPQLLPFGATKGEKGATEAVCVNGSGAGCCETMYDA